MNVVQVFPSFVILSLTCIFVRDGLPSVEMWFDRGEDRCCGLSKVEMMEMVGFRQVMWLVMLESGKDRILGVDTSGQLVPPHVRYGMTCLLIRYALCYVSCSVEWGWLPSLWSIFVTFFMKCPNHMVQEGPLCVRNLSTTSGDHLSGDRSKAWHTPVVDIYDDM
jgi:hypothetical protein